MRDLDIVLIDYYREGNSALIARECRGICDALGIDAMIHVLRPPEGVTAIDDFPAGVKFWPLDRNHGAQQRYSLVGEIEANWSLYVDSDLVPTLGGVEKILSAGSEFGDQFSCYGWLGHNIDNVRGGHLYAKNVKGMAVDCILRAYLFRSEHVRSAFLDYPIFHWEDDLNIQLKIQHRLKRPSWIVDSKNNFVDLGGHEDIAHYRQPGHFERRCTMVAGRDSYLHSS